MYRSFLRFEAALIAAITFVTSLVPTVAGAATPSILRLHRARVHAIHRFLLVKTRDNKLSRGLATQYKREYARVVKAIQGGATVQELALLVQNATILSTNMAQGTLSTTFSDGVHWILPDGAEIVSERWENQGSTRMFLAIAGLGIEDVERTSASQAVKSRDLQLFELPPSEFVSQETNSWPIAVGIVLGLAAAGGYALWSYNKEDFKCGAGSDPRCVGVIYRTQGMCPSGETCYTAVVSSNGASCSCL